MDRNDSVIKTIHDDETGMTHLLSATPRATEGAEPSFSTLIRTILQITTENRTLNDFQLIDKDIVRFIVKESHIGQSEPSNEGSSDYEMIDLVDFSEEPVGKATKHSAFPAKLSLIMGDVRKRSYREAERLSEEELFRKMVGSCQHLLDYLSDDPGDGRQIRLEHTVVERREFALMSARLQHSVDYFTCTVGPLWQTMIRPPKSICHNFWCTKETVSIGCTCDSFELIAHAVSCEHIRIVSTDSAHMQRIKTILTDGESHFGANTSVGM